MLFTGTAITNSSRLMKMSYPQYLKELWTWSKTEQTKQYTHSPFVHLGECTGPRLFVLKVAYSEKRAKFEFAMNGSVHQGTKRIILEQWVLKQKPTNDHTNRVVAIHVQTTWITNPRAPEHPNIGGLFVVSFRSLP